MPPLRQHARRMFEGLFPASRGVGPLLQRDYWAVIRNCRASPRQIAQLVAHRFCELPPPELVQFRRRGECGGALQVGDELDVSIRMVPRCAVRVIHRDENSLTVATIEGHPEAGRITFGAYRNRRGDVVFHIRSRARSSSGPHYAGFIAGGEAMQTNCWTDFVEAVAVTTGDGVLGYIHCDTTQLKEEEPEEQAMCSPTFLAKGD